MNAVSWGLLAVNVGASIAVVAAVMLLTFAYAMKTGVHAIVDSVWALGFVVVAVMTYILSAGHGNADRRALALALTAVWGLRLSGYIYTRNRHKGEDPRYAAFLRRNQGSVARFVLKNVYWAQGRVMFWVSLPVQVAMYDKSRPGPVTWVAVAVWVVGVAFEAVGDLQLARFKADPGNQGAVLDRGLWAWTRHPNYFGDATVWWGLWLLSCSSWVGLATVGSPAVMTYMLVKKTGKALLEKGMRRSRGALYDQYVARTSGFFPRPPRPVRHATGVGS